MESCPETSITEVVVVDPGKVVGDLVWLTEQCEQRCLFECAQWASEQLNHLPERYFEAHDSTKADDSENDLLMRRRAKIMFIRSLIINKDYNRAKFFLSKEVPTTNLEAFLLYFTWYMISVRNRLENDADDLDRKEEYGDVDLSELLNDMEALKMKSPGLFDCFLHYLLGIVRKKSGAPELAVQAFNEAIKLDYRCWPAWESLASLVDGFFEIKLENEAIGRTWLYKLFVADTMFHQRLYVLAIDAYTEVSQHLGSSPYILCQIAAAQSELQEHDSAIVSFQKIRKIDPFRIEQMHFYSDSLYIRQNLVELSVLAKWFYASHKFHWETCCIVANYYSAKNLHEQAQEFLKRAIRLCPVNASIWVLLGHEYLETKNHQAADASYKKAAAINPKCYRGWYGLGQLNEILKKNGTALYYYQKAHKCQPDDSRMLIALGVVFARMERNSDAEKCFKKAFQIGDVEGNALTHLAKLYEEQEDSRNAAKAYEAYLTLYTEEFVGDLNLIAVACRFLARYNLEADFLDVAYNYAQRCLNYDISKEEGYRILSLIKSKRKESQERMALQQVDGTPLHQAHAHQRNPSYRTPTDVPRPIGGGNDSTMEEETPEQQQRKKMDLAGNEDGEAIDGAVAASIEDDEDMNTNSDDDLDISDDL